MSFLISLFLRGPLVVLATVVMGTLSLGASLSGATGRTQHRLARVWARMLLRIAGVRLETEGLEHLKDGCCYVIAANHQSYMDIPVILASLPIQFRFFAKKGLFHVPFLGTHLRRAGHLPVVRNDPRASLKTMSEGARLIRERQISVLLFPEGGRTCSGVIREFKEGMAYIAIKSGVPVMPLAIIGTRDVLPMGSIRLRPGRVQLRVGKAIPTAALKLQDRHALSEMVREQVLEMAGQLAFSSGRARIKA